MTKNSVHGAQVQIIPVALGVPEFGAYRNRDTHREQIRGKVTFSSQDPIRVLTKLLQRELEILLVSAQNNEHFLAHGEKHNLTGGGATEYGNLTNFTYYLNAPLMQRPTILANSSQFQLTKF